MSEQSFSIEAAIIKGRPLPEWAEEEPLLFPGDDFYLFAFDDLTTCRSSGMDVGPIPWTAIIEYAKYKELHADQIEPFKTIIRIMDKAFLSWLADKKDKVKGGK